MIKEEKERIDKDYKWLLINMIKLQKKHSGKWIAVVNKQIAGMGKTAGLAYNQAKKRFPQNEPLLDVVPSTECLIL
ncbi:MAG: DUF5678 domain-containing protein [bacterium]